MYKCLFLICFTIGFVLAAKAQQPDTVAVKSKKDSAVLKRDSIKSKPFKPKVTKEKTYHPDSLHDPHKAVMHSLMIPGWGQLYNHRWWKVPLVYTGLGLLADVVIFNQHYYKLFLKEDILRNHGITTGRNPDFVNIGDADIDAATNSYRRDRDLGYLGFFGFWGVQMVDAYIDAKFIRSYTMDNDLSFKISPAMMNDPAYAVNNTSPFIPAIKITFTLK